MATLSQEQKALSSTIAKELATGIIEDQWFDSKREAMLFLNDLRSKINKELNDNIVDDMNWVWEE